MAETKRKYVRKKVSEIKQAVEEKVADVQQVVEVVDEVVSDMTIDKEMSIAQIKLAMVDIHSRLTCVPKDRHTRGIIVNLYNLYRNTRIPTDCKECIFDQVWSATQLIAKSTM